MNYYGDTDMTQVMGIGYLGEVRQAPDGQVYQWVQGVDGLGNPIGFWKKLRRLARRALPIVQSAASFIPHPAAQAVARGISLARRSGLVGYDGPGAYYGVAQDPTDVMGIGNLGEIRRGPDGQAYQWVQGIDGLGNPIGFWKKLRRFVRRAVPMVQRVASFIPHPAAQAVARGLTIATPYLRRAGLTGVGALYQTSDGSLVEGVGEDELTGFAEDELTGFGEDELTGYGEEELTGFAEDELTGFGEDELMGLAEDDLTGFGQEELQAINGYVRDGGMSGIDAYVPQEPPQTRWSVPPAQPPEIWKPLW